MRDTSPGRSEVETAARDPRDDASARIDLGSAQTQDGPQRAASSRAPDRSGELVAQRYELLERIGEGAMGSVYRAMHTQLRKVFAVKIMHPSLCADEKSVARFQREAQAAAHLDHPNVCAASDFGRTADGEFVLVMEFLEGETLAERLSRAGALSPGDAVSIARQVTSALVRAHALDIVHRDLKPDNIFLARRDGEPHDRVKILDFGIASVHLAALDVEGQDDAALRATLSRAGAIYGTPRYLSPEQASGERADARSDLYSLGVVLYEMLAGQPPFVAPTALALIGMHVTRKPPPLPATVPADLAAIVMRLLEKDPQARFASAAELDTALEQVADGRSAAPLRAAGQGLGARLRAGDRGALLMVAGAALGVVVLSIIIGVALSGGGDAPAPRLPATEGDVPQGDAQRSPETSSSTLGGELLAPVIEPPFETRDEVVAVLALFDEGQVEAGLAKLVELEAEHGERAAYWQLRFQREREHGRLDAALTSLERWVGFEPAAAHAPEAIDLLMTALDEKRGSTADLATGYVVLHLDDALATALATRAVALRRGNRAQRRIFELLARDEARRAALDEWLRVSIDVLETSRGQCSKRRAMVQRLVVLGDPRALPTVEALSSEPREGCGLLSLQDCSDCMRGTLKSARESLSRPAE